MAPKPVDLTPALRWLQHTDHLNPEAVAAFVDGELTASAHRRALDHLRECLECAAEVRGQEEASQALRATNSAADIRAPHHLVAKISKFSAGCEPGPDAAATPTPEPEGVLDKVATMMRMVTRGDQQDRV